MPEDNAAGAPVAVAENPQPVEAPTLGGIGSVMPGGDMSSTEDPGKLTAKKANESAGLAALQTSENKGSKLNPLNWFGKKNTPPPPTAVGGVGIMPGAPEAVVPAPVAAVVEQPAAVQAAPIPGTSETTQPAPATTDHLTTNADGTLTTPQMPNIAQSEVKVTDPNASLEDRSKQMDEAIKAGAQAGNATIEPAPDAPSPHPLEQAVDEAHKTAENAWNNPPVSAAEPAATDTSSTTTSENDQAAKSNTSLDEKSEQVTDAIKSGEQAGDAAIEPVSVSAPSMEPLADKQPQAQEPNTSDAIADFDKNVAAQGGTEADEAAKVAGAEAENPDPLATDAPKTPTFQPSPDATAPLAAASGLPEATDASSDQPDHGQHIEPEVHPDAPVFGNEITSQTAEAQPDQLKLTPEQVDAAMNQGAIDGKAILEPAPASNDTVTPKLAPDSLGLENSATPLPGEKVDPAEQWKASNFPGNANAVSAPPTGEAVPGDAATSISTVETTQTASDSLGTSSPDATAPASPTEAVQPTVASSIDASSAQPSITETQTPPTSLTQDMESAGEQPAVLPTTQTTETETPVNPQPVAPVASNTETSGLSATQPATENAVPSPIAPLTTETAAQPVGTTAPQPEQAPVPDVSAEAKADADVASATVEMQAPLDVSLQPTGNETGAQTATATPGGVLEQAEAAASQAGSLPANGVQAPAIENPTVEQAKQVVESTGFGSPTIPTETGSSTGETSPNDPNGTGSSAPPTPAAA